MIKYDKIYFYFHWNINEWEFIIRRHTTIGLREYKELIIWIGPFQLLCTDLPF